MMFGSHGWGVKWVTTVRARPRVRRLTQTTKTGQPSASVWVVALEMA
jgi:hypothetical protein